MEVKYFQKTQRDLASTINHVIDTYWRDEINESEMIEVIHKLYANNQDKFLKSDQFTTVLRQQCGKKRLEVVNKVLDLDGNVTN